MADDILLEIKKTFDTNAQLVQSNIDELKRETSHTKAEINEKFKKIGEASATYIEKLNELTDQVKKRDEVIDNLEKSLARIGSNSAPMDRDGIRQKTVEDLNNEIKFLDHICTKSFENPTGVVERVQRVLSENKHCFRANKSVEEYTKDVLEGILPDGGYFILPYEWLGRRITRIFETSPMRQICTTINTTKPMVTMVVDDNQVTGETEGGEQTTIAKSNTPQIGTVSIAIHQISELLQVSDYMLSDAGFDIADWIVTKGTNRIVRKQNTNFISASATGATTPRGILSYPKWGGAAVEIGNDNNYERNALEYIKSGGATSLTYNGLVNLQNAVVEDYQPNSSFLMHRTTWGQILQLADTQQRPLFQFQDLLKTGAFNQPLLGKEVRFAADLAQPTGSNTYTGGDAPILYGDFRECYMIVDRLGMQVLRDQYTGAASNIVKFYVKARYGGGLMNFQGLKVLEIGA